MQILNFNTFGLPVIFVWLAGATVGFILKEKQKKIFLSAGYTGALILLTYIIYLWIILERPPMRTLAETRLWYAFFMTLFGNLILHKWEFKSFYIYTHLAASAFILTDILYPETFNKALMPALQSVWFIPHVAVYMAAYALLALSAVISLKGIFSDNKTTGKYTNLANLTVYLGFGFLTAGLIFGALWAKKAWGHYWTWDPKEIWAFITWASYLIYIHYDKNTNKPSKVNFIILIIAFILLIICWFGVQYIPSAANSIHNYAY